MIPIHIGEWIRSGCPKDIWFYIVRQAKLDSFTEDTPRLLITLIDLVLRRYGKYETRRPEIITVFSSNTVYRLDNDYIMYHTIGNVNGKEVPVVAVRAEVKIIDE